MFITAVCVLFLIKLRWPKSKSPFLMHLGDVEPRSYPQKTDWLLLLLHWDFTVQH